MTTPHPATHPNDTGAGAEELQVLISAAITTLTGHLENVTDLLDTRQSGLGFLTHDGRQALDQLIRTEREARAFNQRHGWPTGSGDIPAPLSITAASLLRDIHDTITVEATRLTRAMTTAGICPVYPIPAEPTITQLLEHLRKLTWHCTNPLLLEPIHTRLEDLNTAADKLVEGSDRKQLPDPCPHCQQPTLTVDFRTGIIRCDHPTGDHCICPDPICDCKTNPNHRHEWHRDKRTAPGSWWKLADRLNAARNP